MPETLQREALAEGLDTAECRERRCTWYRWYLVYGGPDLAHAAYHHAEKHCAVIQDAAAAWQRAHFRRCKETFCRHENPYEDEARRWEARLRV